MDADKTRPGKRVGDYEFLDRLAVGGMGELWRVRHVTLGGTYVAKQLRQEYREDAEFLKRFFHEAKLVANLRHPNIVQVFGYDQENTLYLMEYVEGMDLHQLLNSRWELEFPEKRCIIEVVADAIGYAHTEVDMIHRDIKPSNVLLAIHKQGDPITRSRIKLTDFGVARVLSVDQRITMSSGMVVGTVHYMAPEQFEGEADKPSDVYSIGVLYYQLLTGAVPFDGPTAFVIRDKHHNEIPPAPIDVNPEVPQEDSDIVMKCLEKDPARRFQDGSELHHILVGRQHTARTYIVRDRAEDEEPSAGAGHPYAPTAPTRLVKAGDDAGVGPTQVVDRDDAEPTALTRPDDLDELGATQLVAPPDQPGAAGGQAVVATETMPRAKPSKGLLDRTVIAEKKRRAKGKRRVLRWLLGGAAALVVLALVATQVLPAKYELHWSTLRSDPLDTPNGIHVAVCPRVGFGAVWHSVGTITDDAPRPWANWTTWFDSIDVKFSDGLFREFVLTCRKPEKGSAVDFGGATFEQLAEANGVTIVEDLARVGRYVDAVLVPANVGSAQNLADARRFLARVTDLVGRAEGVELDRTRFEAYRAAVSGMAAAAEATADGKCVEAEALHAKAEASIQKILPQGAAEDFLFRKTLGDAIAETKRIGPEALRRIKTVEPVSDSEASIDYMLQQYGTARAAVARYLRLNPGRGAFSLLLARGVKADGDLEAELGKLGNAAPPPLIVAGDYFAKLDALVSHRPVADHAGRFHAAVLAWLDQAVTASASLERAPWLSQCFEPRDLAYHELAQAFWTRAHGARFARAAQRAHTFGADLVAEAAALPATEDGLRAGAAMFDAAGAAFEAILKASHATPKQKEQATASLAACSVRHAMSLFQLGAAGEDDLQLAEVLKLLDRGQLQAEGAPPEVLLNARGLREILRLLRPALRALRAARKENFASPDALGGRPGTLFEALGAFERFTREIAKFEDHPCYRAACAPFIDLKAKGTEGYALGNAAARWLLANALENCRKSQYGEASSLLRGFLLTPTKQPPAPESPLKRLLAPQITTKADALAKLADAFDETKLPADTPKAQRWKTLWDRRLQAKSLPEIEIPPTVAPAAMPEPFRGQEAQWEAMFDLMRDLQAFLRGRLVAEEALRRIEADAGKLWVRDGDTLRPNRDAATPEALEKALGSVKQFKAAAHYAEADDHPARLTALESNLNFLKTGVVGVRQRIDDMLAKDDAKGALDELKARSAVLGKAIELDLTRRAVALWVRAAADQLDASQFEAALGSYNAIHTHGQIGRHREDPTIKIALDGAASASHYCEGQRALAAGPDRFDAARASFQKAGTFRKADALARQLVAFGEAARRARTEPFQAIDVLAALARREDLDAKIKGAAQAAATAAQAQLIGGAAATATAFNAALAAGGWEKLLDTEVVLPRETERLKIFLGQVDAFEVQQPKDQQGGKVVAADKKVRLVRKRLLKFRYKLPGDASLPMSVEQSVQWTLRHLPPRNGKEGRWVISDWEEIDR